MPLPHEATSSAVPAAPSTAEGLVIRPLVDKSPEPTKAEPVQAAPLLSEAPASRLAAPTFATDSASMPT